MTVPAQVPAMQTETVDCSANQETVVLLHGLARTSRSMRTMETSLVEAGYQVVNVDYPSRQHEIAVLVEQVFETIAPQLASASCRVHFVTHSMGGILVRQYLANNEAPGLGRVVMLGPPNQGSEVVDKLGGLALFNFINGPAGAQLGTDEQSIPVSLGAVDFELGVIAGNRSLNPILSMLIPGDDDGKVSIKRAKIDGMKDFIVMPHTHVFMMSRPAVIQQTVHFLQQGRFDHGRSES